MDEYNVHSKFDLEKHKETYIDYLEVIIDENGTIEYAVPSHTYKLEDILKQKLKLESTNDVRELYLSSNRLTDYLEWLVEETKCISVWNANCLEKGINDKQLSSLKLLKLHGLYRGALPK